MAKRRSLKGLLFDFDGTLVDLATDYRGLRRALGVLLADHGISLGSAPLLDALFDPDLPPSVTRDAHRIIDRHEWEGRHRARLVPDSLALCHRVAGAGYAWGLVSNNSRQVIRWCLERFRFPSPDFVVARGDVAKPKPDPSVAALALKRIGLGPGEVMIIGDSDLDASLGEVAGISAWILPRRPSTVRKRSIVRLYSRLGLGIT